MSGPFTAWQNKAAECERSTRAYRTGPPATHSDGGPAASVRLGATLVYSCPQMQAIRPAHGRI